MDLSQQSITDHQFDLNRRGYDPDAVDAHLGEIAAAVTARENEIAALKRTVSELQAKVRDADESEEALRLTLKAAAHAKEELLSGARERAAEIERDATEQAEQLVADAEENAATITEQAQVRAEAMTSGAAAQAREVAGAALSESELLVVRIEQLRAQVGAAEESLRDLSADTTPQLEEARGALDKALESARASAENPELLAAAAPPPQPPQAVSYPSEPVVYAPVHTPEAEAAPPMEIGQPPAAFEEVEHRDEVDHRGDGFTVAGDEQPADDAARDAAERDAAEDAAEQSEEMPPQRVAESSADISDKVDRLLEELREVT